MQEPIVFVTVRVRRVDRNDRVEEYSVTINLNHILIISDNYITLTDNYVYDLTDDSAYALREIIDKYCCIHDCRR